MLWENLVYQPPEVWSSVGQMKEFQHSTEVLNKNVSQMFLNNGTRTDDNY